MANDPLVAIVSELVKSGTSQGAQEGWKKRKLAWSLNTHEEHPFEEARTNLHHYNILTQDQEGNDYLAPNKVMIVARGQHQPGGFKTNTTTTFHRTVNDAKDWAERHAAENEMPVKKITAGGGGDYQKYRHHYQMGDQETLASRAEKSGTSEGAKEGWLRREDRPGTGPIGKKLIQAHLKGIGSHLDRTSANMAVRALVRSHADDASKALDAGDDQKARYHLVTAHMLLDGRSPMDEHMAAAKDLLGKALDQHRHFAPHIKSTVTLADLVTDALLNKSGTSEGAKEGWEHRKQGGYSLIDRRHNLATTQQLVEPYLSDAGNGHRRGSPDYESYGVVFDISGFRKQLEEHLETHGVSDPEASVDRIMDNIEGGQKGIDGGPDEGKWLIPDDDKFHAAVNSAIGEELANEHRSQYSKSNTITLEDLAEMVTIELATDYPESNVQFSTYEFAKSLGDNADGLTFLETDDTVVFDIAAPGFVESVAKSTADMLEKAGTSKGAKLGWEKRRHPGQISAIAVKQHAAQMPKNRAQIAIKKVMMRGQIQKLLKQPVGNKLQGQLQDALKELDGLQAVGDTKIGGKEKQAIQGTFNKISGIMDAVQEKLPTTINVPVKSPPPAAKPVAKPAAPVTSKPQPAAVAKPAAPASTEAAKAPEAAPPATEPVPEPPKDAYEEEMKKRRAAFEAAKYDEAKFKQQAPATKPATSAPTAPPKKGNFPPKGTKPNAPVVVPASKKAPPAQISPNEPTAKKTKQTAPPAKAAKPAPKKGVQMHEDERPPAPSGAPAVAWAAKEAAEKQAAAKQAPAAQPSPNATGQAITNAKPTQEAIDQLAAKPAPKPAPAHAPPSNVISNANNPAAPVSTPDKETYAQHFAKQKQAAGQPVAAQSAPPLDQTQPMKPVAKPAMTPQTQFGPPKQTPKPAAPPPAAPGAAPAQPEGNVAQRAISWLTQSSGKMDSAVNFLTDLGRKFAQKIGSDINTRMAYNQWSTAQGKAQKLYNITQQYSKQRTPAGIPPKEFYDNALAFKQQQDAADAKRQNFYKVIGYNPDQQEVAKSSAIDDLISPYDGE